MRLFILFGALCLAGCVAQQGKPGESSATVVQEDDKLLIQGYRLIAERKADVAIKDYFDKVIDHCKSQYESSSSKFYASRSMRETIYYMAKASDDKRSAVAVAPTCADALYLKGFASIDLGQIDEGEGLIRRAIDMSPVNAMYLSELGHIQQARRDWNAALDTFTRAEKAAQDFSPPDLLTAELSRAKRGMGYSLTELGRFDEAEAKYRECLQLDGNDSKALAEIEYIRNLKQKKAI